MKGGALLLLLLLVGLPCFLALRGGGHGHPKEGPLRRLFNRRIHETLEVSVQEPTLCDPTVQQYSGFLDVSDQKHYFFWFFESQSDPEQDDLILWLNGGPGCSSLIGMLGEKIGPCEIASDLTEVPNPYTWTKNASVIFLDAPTGAGFSHGNGYVTNTKEYAADAYAFFQLFFAEFPQYKDLNFHIFGESYAGHYVPALAAEIARNNLNPSNIPINLQSIGVGNGMTDPLNQYPFYPQMACNNSYGIPVYGNAVCKTMEATLPFCLRLIERCYERDERAACVNATIFCNLFQIVPYKFVGVNPYDIRIPCEFPPLCYDFSAIDEYLNQRSVKVALGTEGRRWKDCNNIVNLIFQLVGYDWMRSVVEDVVYLLDSTKTRLLFYAGDADLIVHHYGIENMSLQLPWSGRDAYQKAPYQKWTPNGENGGEYKNHERLTFLRVYEAGHMVPLDQPARTTVFVNNWIHNRPL